MQMSNNFYGGYNSVYDNYGNPYFNMVEENDQGYVQVVKNIGVIKSRQYAPAVYDMNASFYIFKRSYISLSMYLYQD